MKQITVHAAKTHLSQLIVEACAGEDIVIARGREPVVRLVAIQAPIAKRQFGAMRGRAGVDAAFFEALPADELALWE